MKPSSSSEQKSSTQVNDPNGQFPTGVFTAVNTLHSTLNIPLRQASAPLAQNLSPVQTPITNTNPFTFSTASPIVNPTQHLSSLNSSLSCSDMSFFKANNGFGGGFPNTNITSQQYSSVHHTSHFHLAGFIDPEAGIPLHLIKPSSEVPDTYGKQESSKKSYHPQSQFIVHWMNNKDFHFTSLAEQFSKDIYEKIVKIQQGKENNKKSGKKKVDSSNENFNEEECSADESDEGSDADVNVETRSDEVVIKTKSDNSYDVFENINLDDETKGLLFGNSIDQKVIF